MSTTESAVQRCLDAYNQADAREDARNDFSPDALARVNRAWRRAMPILTPDTLDAFIACLTHGLLYEVFPLAEASKLLYAAQVTLGLLRDRNKSTPSQPQPKSESAAPQVPPTPLPPAQMAPKAQPAAPQVPRNQVDALLEQFFAGKLPAEPGPAHSLTR